MFKKIYGCLLGGAIGDALGMPFTGLSRAEIAQIGIIRSFEKARTTASLFLPLGAIGDSEEGDLLEAGQWTDDTQLALALAETILDEGGLFIPEVWWLPVGFEIDPDANSLFRYLAPAKTQHK